MFVATSKSDILFVLILHEKNIVVNIFLRCNGCGSLQFRIHQTNDRTMKSSCSNCFRLKNIIKSNEDNENKTNEEENITPNGSGHFCWGCRAEWSGDLEETTCLNAECPGGWSFEAVDILRKCRRKMIGSVANCPEVRACPKCGQLIKHWSDCKHMDCVICGTSFCHGVFFGILRFSFFVVVSLFETDG